MPSSWSTPVSLPRGSNTTGVVPPLPFLSSGARGLPPLSEEVLAAKEREQYAHVCDPYGVLPGRLRGRDVVQKPSFTFLCLVQRREGLLASSFVVMLAGTGALKGWWEIIARVRVIITTEHPDHLTSVVDAGYLLSW